jgi:hypothetical protein
MRRDGQIGRLENELKKGYNHMTAPDGAQVFFTTTSV